MQQPLLWQLFHQQSERQFVYRQELMPNGLPVFWVLSQVAPDETNAQWQIQTKSFTPQLKVGQRLAFKLRFGDVAPARRSVEQLRGIEGARVRKTYQKLALQYDVKWKGRRYDPKDWDKGDVINQCISAATACLYGVTEAAILAAGYAPAIGFLHTGKPLSFVYDIADIIKFDTVVPAAFKVASYRPLSPDRQVRMACREEFRKHQTLKKLIPLIDEVLSAGDITPPEPYIDAQPPAIPEPIAIGDSGHRSK